MAYRSGKFAFFTITLIIAFLGCTKSDLVYKGGHGVCNEFYTVSDTSPILIKRVVAELNRLNSLTHFAAQFEKENGKFVWDKAPILLRPNVAHRDTIGSLSNGDTLIIIPLVIAGDNKVNGFVQARLNGGITFEFYRGGDYNKYTYDDVELQRINADKAALQLMWLNNLVYGSSQFNVTDPNLFESIYNPNSIPTERKVNLISYEITFPEGRGWALDFCIAVATGSGPTTITGQGCTCDVGGYDNCNCTRLGCCYRLVCGSVENPQPPTTYGSTGGNGSTGTTGPTGPTSGGGYTGGTYIPPTPPPPHPPYFPCPASQDPQVPPPGCSSPQGPIVVLPYDEIPSPCQVIDALMLRPNFPLFFSTLRTKCTDNYETAFLYKNNVTNYGEVIGPVGELGLSVTPVEPIEGIIHNHFIDDESLSVFSSDDIANLYKVFVDGKMVNPQKFVLGVVTATTSYVVIIEDVAKFNTFGANYINILDDFFYSGYDIHEDNSDADNEKNMLLGLQFMESGLKVFKANSDFTSFSPIKAVTDANNNTTVISASCN